MPLLLIQFARFGPYHYARLKSAAVAMEPHGWEVAGLETAGNDTTYAWDPAAGNASGPRVITAFPGRVHEEITAAECRRILHPLLDRMEPDAIAIAGWGSPDARACLDWCKRRGAKAIAMSETREADGRRVWWKELVKSRIIRKFDAALVGGKSQRDYLMKLGIPAGKIRLGYNVVDNAYFATEAVRWRCQVSVVDCRKYFLASNRFIERKNLARLIEAYASYIQISTSHHQPSTLWSLCLLGDGELKAELIAQCHRHGLKVAECAPWEHDFQPTINHQPSTTIYFPGFRQIEELPRFYAHAGCFVHPALEEPWGLVINEAMSCGLPVLSGSNVGAADELVEDGLNGWKFDAGDVGSLAGLLARISATDFPLAKFGLASRRILDERCSTAAFGQGLVEILHR